MTVLTLLARLQTCVPDDGSETYLEAAPVLLQFVVAVVKLMLVLLLAPVALGANAATAVAVRAAGTLQRNDDAFRNSARLNTRENTRRHTSSSSNCEFVNL